jgi:hypothetical protein
MKLEAEAFLPFSREAVFRAYRDRLVELVPFLPSIRAIECSQRVDEPPITRVVNVWHGGGDIPKIARSFLSEKMLSWTDHATWDESRFTCDWRMEAHSFRDAIDAAGANEFHLHDGGCRFVVRGNLSIDGKKLPVPRFLASSAGPAVAKFLAGMIRPNLTEVSKAVERLLAQSR